MAIFHCCVKVIGRGSGKSAVAAAAYRSGEKLVNEYDGFTHDYTKKSGIVHTEILTPESAPEWTHDRSKLWNAVEQAEKRKDSQLSREVEIALPKEIDLNKQKILLRHYVNSNFVEKGMIADIAIHDKGDGNPHAHIMLTMRPVDENGFMPKKDRSWNDKELLESWRKDWEKRANWYLRPEQHISHESFEKKNVYQIPTKHLGPYAAALEKRSIQTEIGDYNRHVATVNQSMDRTRAAHNRETAEARKEKDTQPKQKTPAEKRTEFEQEQKKLISGIREREESILSLKNEIWKLDREKTSIFTGGITQKLDCAEKHRREMEKIAQERKKLSLFDFNTRSELNRREKRELQEYAGIKKSLSIPDDLNILRQQLDMKEAKKILVQDKIAEKRNNIDLLEKEVLAISKEKKVIDTEIEKLKSPEEKERDLMKQHITDYCKRHEFMKPDKKQLAQVELWLKDHPEHQKNREEMFNKVTFGKEKEIVPEKIAKEVEKDLQRSSERSHSYGLER